MLGAESSWIVHNTDKPFFYVSSTNWRSSLNRQIEWKLNFNTNTKVVVARPKDRFRSECHTHFGNDPSAWSRVAIFSTCRLCFKTLNDVYNRSDMEGTKDVRAIIDILYVVSMGQST